MAAAAVVVPDNAASIQAALDSGADTVIVRDGTYSESLVIREAVTLVAWTSSLAFDDATPEIEALTVMGPRHAPGVVVGGFHVRGAVRVVSPPLGQADLHAPIRFESCRLDSGVSTEYSDGNLGVALRGCIVSGDVRVSGNSLDVSLCAIRGGGISGSLDGGATIQSNDIQGPAPFGISLAAATIRGNTIAGTTDGILVGANATALVEDNQVRDCSGVGIRSLALFGGGRLAGNTVRNCGIGMHVAGFRGQQVVTENIIEACALDGILLESDRTAYPVLARNVVSRCGGNGISVRASAATVSSNTTCLNGQAGIAATVPVASIDHNLAYGNHGAGLAWSDASSPPLHCNDWYGNDAGPTSGAAPGPADLDVDPLFCDVGGSDFHLAAASPLADTSACGSVGALGVGCGAAGVALRIEGEMPERIGGLLAIPGSLTVPDQVASIQAAIDAGADTVVVRDGWFPESLVVARPLVLTAWKGVRPDGDATPRIRSVAVAGARLVMIGFHTRGIIRLSGNAWTRFESCRMDSGLVTYGEYGTVALRGCLVMVGTQIHCNALDASCCSVVGGLSVVAYGWATIESNDVRGPATSGLHVEGDGRAIIVRNTVTGVTDGYIIGRNTPFDVHNNQAIDCSGSGFVSTSVITGQMVRNVALRCGGRGLSLSGYRAAVLVADNVVEAAGDDGIYFSGYRPAGSSIARNVVSRCGGNGIHVDAPMTAVSGNTTCSNSRSGIVVEPQGGVTVDHNIAYGNHAFGLEWPAGVASTFACNDWFANASGGVSGAPPDTSDLTVDPLFCSAPIGDFHLLPNSAVLDAAGCDLIGALGLGCVDAPTAAMLELFEAEPVEAGIVLRWRFGGSASFVSVTAERANSSNGPWIALAPVVSEGGGFAVVDRQVVTGSVYFYRLSAVAQDGSAQRFGPISATAAGATIAFSLEPLAPNPANRLARITYVLPLATRVRLSVVDLQGRETVLLADGVVSAGRHVVQWDTRSAGARRAPGIYFVRCRADGASLTRRVIFVD